MRKNPYAKHAPFTVAEEGKGKGDQANHPPKYEKFEAAVEAGEASGRPYVVKNWSGFIVHWKTEEMMLVDRIGVEKRLIELRDAVENFRFAYANRTEHRSEVMQHLEKAKTALHDASILLTSRSAPITEA